MGHIIYQFIIELNLRNEKQVVYQSLLSYDGKCIQEYSVLLKFYTRKETYLTVRLTKDQISPGVQIDRKNVLRSVTVS